MSNLLREDIQETAIISEKWHWFTGHVIEEYSQIKDLPIFGLFVLLDERGVGRDDVISTTKIIADSHARLHDKTWHQVQANVFLRNKIKAKERWFLPYAILIDEHGRGTAQVLDKTKNPNLIKEIARVRETWHGYRVLSQSINASAKIRDDLLSGYLTIAHDTAVLKDSISHHLDVFDRMNSVARGVDVILTQKNQKHVIHSKATIHHRFLHHTKTGAISHDRLAAWGAVLGYQPDDMGAVIWTSNTDTWAMSRYGPARVHQLAVINGIVYGFSKSGVYTLNPNSHQENIIGHVKTGLIDTSNGGLLHPVGSYIEYTRNQETQIDLAVTTPQSGNNERFIYRLARERANSLTNGRFIFGRGLRGRHFAFELIFKGKNAFLNDWTIDCVPTKRRI